MAGLHGRRTRVLLDGVDLSCHLRQADLSLEKDVAESTAFCDGVRAYQPGFANARASIQGYYDEAANGPLYSILPAYAADDLVRFVRMPNGYGVGSMCSAFEGFVTNFSRSAAVSDIQALALDSQVSGEVLEMVTLINFDTEPLGGTAPTSRNVVRSSALPAPYNSTFSGMLYLMVKNTGSGAATFEVGHGSDGSAATNNTTITSGSLAPGDIFVGTAGTFGQPISVGATVQARVTGSPGVPVNVYVGMVNTAISLLRR